MPRPSDDEETIAPAARLDGHAAQVSGNGGAGQVGPDGEVSAYHTEVGTSKCDFPSDESDFPSDQLSFALILVSKLMLSYV